MTERTTRAIPPRPRQLDSPLLPRIFKFVGRCQVWLYRRTGGRIGGKWRIGAGFRKPVPTLLLEHRGRKSGTVYTTPLLYIEDGSDVVVVASQGGLPKHPQWYRNLCANPHTRIQVGRQCRDVTAATADSRQRDRLWPLLVDAYADFDTYQSWAEREIPVVLLRPRSPIGSPG
ncbi:nitroreductase family deazaflavin-dependent oxidoreductase [Rhodococcus maanshanensis]|uniref:Deazaflavin-dependent oxidoreductase, nitroreductase family n=1 Tax=Rhodococcus maanshanensis TaxID=183556 RepID=A0A1H7ULL4_9NOCA|nr:deazaflavin-dependent oxidoreductase, nitroreductase family [Rhodococcus maanshanensis]